MQGTQVRGKVWKSAGVWWGRVAFVGSESIAIAQVYNSYSEAFADVFGKVRKTRRSMGLVWNR